MSVFAMKICIQDGSEYRICCEMVALIFVGKINVRSSTVPLLAFCACAAEQCSLR